MKNPNVNEYDLIISLGEACFVATYLRDSQLRAFSSPFDWLMGGNLQTRLNFLTNNFKDFMNIEDFIYLTKHTDNNYTKLGVIDFDTVNEVCFNKNNQLIFLHDFVREKSFEEQFSEVLEKYQRRIKRLLEAIQNSKKILFIYAERPRTTVERINIDELIETLVFLNIFYKNTYIKLFYLQWSENPDSSLKIINKYFDISEYFSLDAQPDLKEVFKSYNFKITQKKE